MSVARGFARFAVVGTAGFVVDVAALYAALFAGCGYLSARALSFSVAVLSTWAMNRSWTFARLQRRGLLAELWRYVLAMSAGGAVNYAVYALTVTQFPPAAWLPLLGTALGSIAGLVVNFSAAQWWVFAAPAKDREPPPASGGSSRRRKRP